MLPELESLIRRLHLTSTIIQPITTKTIPPYLKYRSLSAKELFEFMTEKMKMKLKNKIK